MTMDYDPISSLEAIGYLEREASFLYLVAIHSGYFLRRQYSRFAGRDGGTLIARFLRKADRHHHIRVIECGQGWHIYHLASQSLYAALERPGSQNRRIKGDAYIKSRLMVLDFVLAHLSANILEDEAGKVDFFTTQCGIRSELLPRSHAGRLVYFPDGFPILVSNAGVPTLVFFDEGQVTATRFERYLKQYQPLFAALGEFELIFVADNENNSARAKAAFGRFLPADRLRGVTPMTPLGVDHFLEFLSVRRQSEVEGRGVLASNLRVLREGEAIYTTLEHQALYSAWKLEPPLPRRYGSGFFRHPCVWSSPPWFFRIAIRSISCGTRASLRKAARPHTRPRTRPLTERISHDRSTSCAKRWDRDRYVREVGATPGVQPCGGGSAALVAPTSRTLHIQQLSGADISPIRTGYKPDQFSIHR